MSEQIVVEKSITAAELAEAWASAVEFVDGLATSGQARSDTRSQYLAAIEGAIGAMGIALPSTEPKRPPAGEVA